MMDRNWIVVLEAAAPKGESLLDINVFQRLVEELGDHEPTALFDSDRYALQLGMESRTESEALSVAVARWRQAVRKLHLPVWDLARAEVLTVEEFEADQLRAADQSLAADAGDSPDDDPGSSPSDELLRRVFTDSLTGLANRELFRDQVRGALNHPSHAELAVLLLDIDDFAAVNHAVGYAAGDQVLAALASRLIDTVGPAVTARVGGDAFAALLTPLAGSALDEIAARVVEGVRIPLTVAGCRLRVTASVGVASATSATEADELIGNARSALSAAKTAGGDDYRLYEEGLADSSRFDFDAEPTPDRMAYVVLLQRAALAANESTTLEAAAASVLQQVCALTGWTAGHLWTVDSTDALVATGVWNASVPPRLLDFRDRIGDGFRAVDGLPGKVLATSRPAWTHNLAAERHASAAGAVDACIRTSFAFPVLVQSRVVAILEFFSDRLLAPDDLLTDVMASVCAQLGRVAERRRAEAALSESEARYHTLADSAPMMIWRSSTDGTCTFFNSTWLEFTGRTLEEELGDGWVEGVHPDDVADCMDTYLESFGRREPFEMEYRIRRADGEYRWMLDRGRPVGEGDAFAGYVGGCVDVTDRRRAEHEVRDREARFRALMQNTNVMIVVLAADGALLEEYTGTFDLGYEIEPRIGRFGMEHLHPDDLPRAAAEFARVVAQPGPGRLFECRIQHADGSWQWIEAMPNNLLDDPVVRGVVITVTDITARKQAEGETLPGSAVDSP